MQIIENDINPFVDEWEKKGIFDGHGVYKKLGQAGLLGICREPEYGGMGLDYSYSIAFMEELGSKTRAAGVATSIAVQTEVMQPALSRFGSDELKLTFLKPTIAGDWIGALCVTEPGSGSDVSCESI